jgi:radical SAM protein (TIGR01212 family)
MLTERVHTFGQWLKNKHGERVHKIALDVGFTCPNRDGSKGIGGCTFCNNASFSPSGRGGNNAAPLDEQFESGRRGVDRCTRAKKYLAYFQAYTNTYGEVAELKRQYDQALAMDGVIGLAIGTRPDCVPDSVLDLLSNYRQQGLEIILELGLQSAFDETLDRVNRGHGIKDYIRSCLAARRRGIPVCTHLIVGLPGEDVWHCKETLKIVLDIGTDGLKLHPLHVVKHTLLAKQWRQNEYTPLDREEYVSIAADLIELTPWNIPYHRVTGTAPADLLLAPTWCSQKWPVVNAIDFELQRRNSKQGDLHSHGTLQ